MYASRLCCAILTIVTLAVSSVQCSKLRGLEIRINALDSKMSTLEKKVYIGESELRYELDLLWKQLNESGAEEQHGNELDLSKTDDDNHTNDIGQVLKSIEKRSDLMMMSFVKEKELIRNFVKEMENEMILLRKQQIDSLDNFRNDTDNILIALKQSVAEELAAANKMLEDNLAHIQQELEKKFSDHKASSVEHFNSLKESTVNLNNNTIESMERRFDSMENIQRNLLDDVKNKTDGMVGHLDQVVNDGLKNVNIAQELAENRSNEFETMVQIVKGESDICSSQAEKTMNYARLLLSELNPAAGWNVRGNTWYKLVEYKAAWQEAVNNCSSFGAYLVEVNSLEENNFLAEIVQQLSSGTIWLGGSDLEFEGHWKWMKSREPFSFWRWNVGEPNNSHGNEDCLEIPADHKAEGLWNDAPCSVKNFFVCEITFAEDN